MISCLSNPGTLISILLASWLAMAGSPARGQILQILAPVTSAAPLSAKPEPALAPPVSRVEQSEVCETLARRLTERLALTEGELTLTFVAPWTPLVKPAAPLEVTLLQAPDLKGLTSRFFLTFRLEAGGQPLGEWHVPVNAQLTREVWVSTRRLIRGEKPDATADLEKRLLNVLAERQAPILASAALDDFEVAQTVAAGQALTWRDLSARAAVRRGQTVTVVAGDALFSVSMKAQATQDGAMGATVRVRNLVSLRDIDARVVGEGKVQVSF